MIILRTYHGAVELGRMHPKEVALQEMWTQNLSDKGKTMLL